MIPISVFLGCVLLSTAQYPSCTTSEPMLWYLTSVMHIRLVCKSRNSTYYAALRLSTSLLHTRPFVSPRHNDAHVMSKESRKAGSKWRITFNVTLSALLPSCQAMTRRVQPCAPPRLDFCSFPRVCDQDSSSIRNQDWR